MKLCILYHADSEFARPVDEFEKNCRLETTIPIEKLNVDSPEGAATAALYDIMTYPAILVLRDDGQLFKGWQGPSFPPVSDVVVSLNV